MASDTRVVYLLRHAKSDWGDDSLPDHERPLNGRGKRSSSEISTTLDRQAICPELVLVSTARRARQTVKGFADALPSGVAMHFEDGLYGASATDLLARLRTVDDAVGAVLLVGHNPGMEVLAGALVRPGSADALAEGMKTATLVGLAFTESRWSQVAPGTGDLIGVWQHPGERD